VRQRGAMSLELARRVRQSLPKPGTSAATNWRCAATMRHTIGAMREILQSLLGVVQSLLGLGRVAVGPGLPWLSLVGAGLIMQGFSSLDTELASGVALPLYVAGGLAVIAGTTGLGVQIGRHRADETLRLKLAPAFRRTFRIYQRLAALQRVIGERRTAMTAEVRQNGTVDFDSVEASLQIIEARLDEQVLTVDDAIDEWKELTPNEIDRLRASVESQW
jgi:hypothetical protein